MKTRISEKHKSEVIDYIIKFLLPYNENLASRVGYTSSREEFHNYDVIILPCGLFDEGNYGSTTFIPTLPLKKFYDTEIFFGDTSVEDFGGKIVIGADIIACSFFLLSRYEEFIFPDKVDIFGRFDFYKSLNYKGNFIFRPLVDEYSSLLIDLLRRAGAVVNPIPQEIDKIYLTHDIDLIGAYQDLGRVARGVYHALIRRKIPLLKVLKSYLNIKNDPANTFDWIVQNNLKAQNIETVFFIKAVVNAHKIDRPKYDIWGKRFDEILSVIQASDSKIGLHSSYQAFFDNTLIKKENELLSERIGLDTVWHRSHYLAILPPNQPQYYTSAGITDDFTIGFAACAGFRLGTCRPVKWINPEDFSIHPIMLHPLTAMDVSFSNPEYMNMDQDAAINYLTDIIQQIKKYNGQVILLWHNTSFNPYQSNYHRELYKNILSIF